jgi:hypothetical protein
MKFYCEIEHLHSFVQGIVVAEDSTEGLSIQPREGRFGNVGAYCITLESPTDKATEAICKVIDSWVVGDALEYMAFLEKQGYNLDPDGEPHNWWLAKGLNNHTSEWIKRVILESLADETIPLSSGVTFGFPKV